MMSTEKRTVARVIIDVDMEKFMGAKAYSVIDAHIGKPVADVLKALVSQVKK